MPNSIYFLINSSIVLPLDSALIVPVVKLDMREPPLA